MPAEIISFPVSFHYIQIIRLIHAISETKYQVSVPQQDIPKFEILSNKFGVKLSSEKTENVLKCIKMNHELPLTSFGKIQKTLIFPKAIASYCKTLWKSDREIKYAFPGLITEKRSGVLANWIEKTFQVKAGRLVNSEFENFIDKVLNKLSPTKGRVKMHKIQDLVIWNSTKGRFFPIKAWDEDYFRILANSQFVLCLNGDFIWSYRFFEAILCGAIPVIEEFCAAYEGFKFYTLEDDLSQVTWDPEIAEYNYNLCLERITCSNAELEAEIEDQLATVSAG